MVHGQQNKLHVKEGVISYFLFLTKKIEKVIKSAEKLPDKLDNDSRLVRKRYGNFYLCIPKPLDKSNGLSKKKHCYCFYDPEIQTFFFVFIMIKIR